MKTTTKKTYYKSKKKTITPPSSVSSIASIDPSVVAAIRQSIIDDLANGKKQEEEKQAKIKEEAEKAHKAHVELMYTSTEPWVEIQSWTDTPKGARVELDWNDAFIAHLRANGFTGADEDQIAQKYLALLTQQAAENMEEKQDSKLE